MKTPAGHTLAGTLTLPKSASRNQPVSAIVTVTGSGPQMKNQIEHNTKLTPVIVGNFPVP